MKNNYYVQGDTVFMTVKGTGGKLLVTQFDLEDLEKVSGGVFERSSWRVNNHGYVVLVKRIDGKFHNFTLHKVLLEGDIIDHIDRDKLNNKKSNLRAVTQQQNNWNKASANVCLHKASGLWRAYVTKDGKQRSKYATTKEEAEKLAQELKEKYFGEFCS